MDLEPVGHHEHRLLHSPPLSFRFGDCAAIQLCGSTSNDFAPHHFARAGRVVQDISLCNDRGTARCEAHRHLPRMNVTKIQVGENLVRLDRALGCFEFLIIWQCCLTHVPPTFSCARGGAMSSGKSPLRWSEKALCALCKIVIMYVDRRTMYPSSVDLSWKRPWRASCKLGEYSCGIAISVKQICATQSSQ